MTWPIKFNYNFFHTSFRVYLQNATSFSSDKKCSDVGEADSW